jgi:hypothetical protein
MARSKGLERFFGVKSTLSRKQKVRTNRSSRFQTVLIFPITSCGEACAGWYESPAQKGQLAEG